MKLVYTVASTNDLIFLLSPTNKIIHTLLDFEYTFIKESGYYYDHLNIVIGKSCSGFNFWALCYLMLSILGVNNVKSHSSKISVVFLTLPIAYVLTVLVNSSRIFTSILLKGLSAPLARSTMVHEVIGIITNLTFLVVIFLIAEYFLLKRSSHAQLT